MYQPSDVLPQTRFSGISHLNPLVSVNPSEMSGFGPHDDTPRFRDERSPVPDSDVRFSGRYRKTLCCYIEVKIASRFGLAVRRFALWFGEPVWPSGKALGW